MKKIIFSLPILALISFLYFQQVNPQDGPNLWTQTYNNNGRVYAMAINPVTQTIIYEGGLDSGVYKTTNGGVNWFPVNNGLTYIKVQALAIGTSNPNVLYAGTDNLGSTNSGVYKTTDGGANWTLVNTGIVETAKGIQAIVVNPANPNIAYITVFDGATNSTNGIYKTTDGGANWVPITNGLGANKNFLSIAMNPLNPNVLYAGTSYQPPSTGPSKIYKTYDGGANWIDMSNGLPSLTTNLDPVRALSVSTVDTSVVLAGLFLNDTLGGAYLTTNGGQNWVKKYGLPNVGGTLPRTVIIRPGTSNQFFVGLDGGGATSRGVWRSIDGGATWADFNNGALLNSYTVRALIFKTVGDTTVYAGAATTLATGRGVFEYSWPVPVVCNFQWNVQTSGTTSLLQSVSAVSDQIGWAGGATGTVRRTTDGGQTWGNGNPNPGVISGSIYNIFAIDANTAWCTTTPSTTTFIYRTTNAGVNWTQVFSQSGGFIDAIQFLDANTGYAYGDPVSATWVMLQTTNGGVNWTQMATAPAQVGSEAGWNNAMIILGTNIWFGTSNTRVYHSTNLGVNWTSGPTTGLVNTYAVHFNSTLFGIGAGGPANNVMKSTDGGTTYTVAGTVPGTGNVTGAEGNVNDFWVTRGNNVYRSSDGGNNWAAAYTGTAALWDIDFAIVAGCPNGWAVGATGTIVRMVNIVGISNNNNEVPNAYILSQNYPNPFNPVTEISFALPKASNVKLVVFDLLGREVETLVNEFKPAGTHKVGFNAVSLASGVYFYRIEAGDFTDTKKMVLIK